jgi:hypothetical protein
LLQNSVEIRLGQEPLNVRVGCEAAKNPPGEVDHVALADPGDDITRDVDAVGIGVGAHRGDQNEGAGGANDDIRAATFRVVLAEPGVEVVDAENLAWERRGVKRDLWFPRSR